MKFYRFTLLLTAILFTTISGAQYLIPLAGTNHCGTAEARQHWLRLKNSNSRAINTPPVLPSEVILHTTHFEVHYTLTGVNAVTNLDNNSNTIPDLIDTIAQVAEVVYANYATRGYMMPPPAPIGDSAHLYDIYVGNVQSGVYGITVPYDTIGNNPNSPETEKHSTASYLILRKDYTVFTPAVNPLLDLQVTISHEFSHAIDYAYNFFISFWLTESRAAFEESVVYPSLIDNFQYLTEIIDTPDIALNLDMDDNDVVHSQHFYGSWIFHRYIADQYQTDYLKPVLAALRSADSVSVSKECAEIQNTLMYDHETSLREEFNNFVIANHFLTADAAYSPYTYTKGTMFNNYLGHTTANEATLNYTGTDIVHQSAVNGNARLQRLSADYFRVTSDRNFSVQVNIEGKDSIYSVIVIKKKTGSTDFEFAVCGFTKDSVFAANITDNHAWDEYEVIVVRHNFYTKDTLSKQYTLTISQPLLFLNWNYKNSGFLYASNFSVAVDQNNVLWTTNSFADVVKNGYAVGGLTTFNGFNWKHYHYYNTIRKPGTFSFPGGGNLNDIDVSPNNHIWFSDPNSGLYEYDRSVWELHDDDNVPQTGNWGEKMDARNTGNVWCAINGKGLFEINGGVITHATSPSISTSCVRFAAGKKFVGTHDAGLIVDNGGSITVYDTSNGLAAMSVTDVEVDKQGNWWVGSYGKGVAFYNGTSWTIYDPWNPSGAFVATRINNVEVDDSGTVWLANDNDGITRYKNGTWHTYDKITTNYDFPAYAVYDIAIDKHGCLFLGTDNGVVYFCDTAKNTIPLNTESLKANFAELKLFPNPTRDVLNIYYTESVFTEKTQIKFFDLSGRLVQFFSAGFTSNLLKVDISNLESGVYLVEVNKVRKKLMKM